MCGGGLKISEGWNPYDEREDEYERRREFSDFRNSSHSTLKYLRGTLQTAIESLKEDGMGEKEAVLFAEQIVAEEYTDSEAGEEIDEEEEILQRLRVSAHRLQSFSDPFLTFLGKSIELQLQELLSTSQTLQTDTESK